MTLSPPLGSQERPEDRIRRRHEEYYRAARRFRLLYYITRLVGGISAAILPFVVHPAPQIAISLSIVIIMMTVIDTVFSPKERYKSLSRATDLLFVANLKAQGRYREFEEQLNIILTTEDQQMLQLLGLDEMLSRLKE